MLAGSEHAPSWFGSELFNRLFFMFDSIIVIRLFSLSFTKNSSSVKSNKHSQILHQWNEVGTNSPGSGPGSGWLCSRLSLWETWSWFRISETFLLRWVQRFCWLKDEFTFRETSCWSVTWKQLDCLWTGGGLVEGCWKVVGGLFEGCWRAVWRLWVEVLLASVPECPFEVWTWRPNIFKSSSKDKNTKHESPDHIWNQVQSHRNIVGTLDEHWWNIW